MNTGANTLAVGLLMTVGWSACGSGPDPATLFADAEGLRLRYEKHASEHAIERYEHARQLWAHQRKYREAATAAQRIGATYEQLGRLQKASASYEHAVQLSRQAGDALLESEIRSDIGYVRAGLADTAVAFDGAERECQGALQIAQQKGARGQAAKALTCLGEVAYYRRLPEQALAFYEEAGNLADALGNRRAQAQAHLYRGYVHSDLSRFEQAEASYERARQLWTLLNDRRQLAITLVAEARLRVRRGEYQTALSRLFGALELLQPMGDVVWEGSTLTGIARVYQDMGESRSALDYWERALRLFETSGLNSVLSDVLIACGETYLAIGDELTALNRFERGLAVAEQAHIDHWMGQALRWIGVIHLRRRDAARAREFLERSLTAQASPDVYEPRVKARTLADMGEATGLLGEQAASARYFTEAVTLSRTAGDRVAEARGLFGLARAAMARNDLNAARRHIEQSLTVVESLRTEVEHRDLRASYFASVYRYHEFYVEVLMRLHAAHPRRGFVATAFEVSERARARSLLESLAEAGVDLRAGVDPDLLTREQALNRAFDDWAERRNRLAHAQAAGVDAETLAREYRQIEDRARAIQSEIRIKSPRYAALVRPRPVTVEALQAQVLDGNTALLEYALGEERSYLWAVGKTEHAVYELPPRAVIEGLAQRVSERLTAPLANDRERHRRREPVDTDFWREAGRLSDTLLAPVARIIAGKRIVVVADGALQYVPFGALPSPGARGDPVPMLVEHEILNVPSASVLAVLRTQRSRPSPAGTVAVLADPVFEADDPRLGGARAARAPSGGFPRLAATRREAAAILASAPAGTTLRALDFAASRATALDPDLRRFRIVHFATHGVVDNENPGLSGVVLSMFDAQGRPRDGFLRLRDIYGLQLAADLVVLSACDTALGKQVRGEGLVGIVRGFMYAGARRVVATLWRVDDDATAEMMTRFYQEMLGKGRSPAAALREAQLAMWRQARWRSPSYWAAFVLQGEWN